MGLILFIIVVIAILTILLFLFALKINLIFNSDKPDINMTLLWLYPFIRVLVTIENAIPVIQVYLFNKFILKKAIKQEMKKHKGMDIVKITNPTDIQVNVQYGFRDPFTTGIACGVISAASQLINIDYVNQIPDFISTNDYIYLNATAKVNLGSALINYMKPGK